ncbi:MAG TPA: HNH endonuclease signature motif containing protein, partial [Acidimicrobiales bacterium]
CLSLDAAGFVDQQVAGFAHRVGPAQTQRLVEDAIARFMPDFAAERRRDAAEARHFDIDTDQVSFAGTARVHGELDLADALDLDDAIRAGAADLAALGSADSLDVRRAAAVGMLARGDQPLALAADQDADLAADQDAQAPAAGAASTTREVVLFVHLSEDAVRTREDNAPVRLENAGGQLLTAAQVADWCGRPDTTQITVKPVIDLNQPASTDAYQVPPWLAERVRLRDRTCVHPYCNRPARGCDLDHIVPYDSGGPTALDNLACLCRLHHRMKTHAGWTYSMLLPGTYLWHSPHGHTWLTDPHGTTDLTPDTVEPPRQPDTDPPERRTT